MSFLLLGYHENNRQFQSNCFTSFVCSSYHKTPQDESFYKFKVLNRVALNLKILDIQTNRQFTDIIIFQQNYKNHQDGGCKDTKTMNMRTLPWDKSYKISAYLRLEFNIEFRTSKSVFLYAQRHFLNVKSTQFLQKILGQFYV